MKGRGRISKSGQSKDIKMGSCSFQCEWHSTSVNSRTTGRALFLYSMMEFGAMSVSGAWQNTNNSKVIQSYVYCKYYCKCSPAFIKYPPTLHKKENSVFHIIHNESPDRGFSALYLPGDIFLCRLEDICSLCRLSQRWPGNSCSPPQMLKVRGQGSSRR